MTLSIELTPEEEWRIRVEANELGLAVDEFVRQRLLHDPEFGDPDDLTPDEIAEINAGIRRGLEAAAQGRETPFAEWAEAKRKKYGLSRPDHAA